MPEIQDDESQYETEYALRKDIHYRKGEILRLECICARHYRTIEKLTKRLASGQNTDEMVEKVEFADDILHKLGIETMAKYMELVERGDIAIRLVNYRDCGDASVLYHIDGDDAEMQNE